MELIDLRWPIQKGGHNIKTGHLVGYNGSRYLRSGFESELGLSEIEVILKFTEYLCRPMLVMFLGKHSWLLGKRATHHNHLERHDFAWNRFSSCYNLQSRRLLLGRWSFKTGIWVNSTRTEQNDIWNAAHRQVPTADSLLKWKHIFLTKM